jgi:hypothetical protein
MKRFFQIIKKKKHKRIFSVMWVFLIAIELFCPVFCDEPAYAAQQNSPISIVQSLSENEDSAAISDYQSTQEEKVCNDECLCHATAIIGIGFSTPEKSFFRSERIAFLTSNPYTNSLPPPYHPPKNS